MHILGAMKKRQTTLIRISEKYTSQPLVSSMLADTKATMRILIADDNPLVRYCLSTLFEKWGLQYTVCENGQQAWDKLKKEHFDLLFLDLQMPQMSGLDIIRQLRSADVHINKALPIVVVSALENTEELQHIKKIGANACLLKPLRTAMVFECVCRYGKLSKQRQANLYADDIDYDSLQELYADDKEHIAFMFKLFLKNTPLALAEITKAMEQNKLDQVGRLLHKMKPSFSLVGLRYLREEVDELELKVKDQPKGIKQDLIHFREHVEKGMRMLRQEERKLAVSK